jgi:hypothetical protein
MLVSLYIGHATFVAMMRTCPFLDLARTSRLTLALPQLKYEKACTEVDNATKNKSHVNTKIT